MIGSGRRNLFKRPAEDDVEGRVIKAKPIDERLARRLGGYESKDFVTATSSQKEFYGNQQVLNEDSAPSESGRQLTADEKNKLSAKIMKAEIKGNTALASKLKRKLESGVEESDDGGVSSDQKGDVLLTRTDFRTGLTVPVGGVRKTSARSEKNQEAASSLRDLVHEEKMTTSEDQLSMFAEIGSKSSSSQKVDDDWTVDDVLLNKKKGRKKHEREERRAREFAISEHKRIQQTLDTCKRCLDSNAFLKHTVVATGFKTYLSVPPMQSLVDFHCYICPMMHVSSSVQLDEDVYAEMKIWRKGLVAMFGDREEDCVFMETARNIRHQPHMFIECIPMPKDVGDTAPIYFKKAILECEEEWAQNKKLIELKDKDIRRSIPKGFSYFAVDFGLQGGFAHAIENDERFPSHFGKEIIGGMLDVDHNLWRKPNQQTFEEQSDKAAKFKRIWKLYDWTEKAKERLKDD